MLIISQEWEVRKYLAILAIIAAFIIYAGVSLWTLTNINHQFISDIDIYLRAGNKILRSEDPYQPFSLGTSFVYPPAALLLFAPLSFVESAHLLWTALSLACLVAASWILASIFRPSASAKVALAFTVAMVFFTPSLEGLTIGQVNFVVLFCLALFVRGYLDQKYQWSGDLGLALAISIKMSPAILVALPFFSRDWKRCLRIAVGLGSLLAITVILWGIGPWLDFLQVFPTILRGFPFTLNEAIGPSLQWLAWRIGLTANLYWVGRVFSGLVLLSWLGAAALGSRRKPAAALLGLGITTMVTSSNLIWFHHLTFLIIPFACLVLSRTSWASREAGVTVCSLVAFGLVHIGRLVEYPLDIPPVAAIAGYQLLFAASLMKVILMEPEPLPG